MRYQLQKLFTGRSTKSERRFGEFLKNHHIPFRCKVKIQNREVDFLIGRLVVELDGHPQSPEKNRLILGDNYDVLHLENNEVQSPIIQEWLARILPNYIHS